MPGIMVGMLISRRRDSTGAVLGYVVIAPVDLQRQVPCDIFQQALATVGGVSYSVHRQRCGFPRCEQRQADRGDSTDAVLGGFAAYSCFAMLGSTVDTCSCSALGGFWTNFQYFLREVVLGSCSCSVLVLLVTIRHVLCSFDCRLVDAALVVNIGSGMCWRVLLVLMHVALCGLWGLSCLAAWRSVHS